MYDLTTDTVLSCVQVVEVVQGQFEIDWMEGVVPGWPVSLSWALLPLFFAFFP